MRPLQIYRHRCSDGASLRADWGHRLRPAHRQAVSSMQLLHMFGASVPTIAIKQHACVSAVAIEGHVVHEYCSANQSFVESVAYPRVLPIWPVVGHQSAVYHPHTPPANGVIYARSAHFCFWCWQAKRLPQVAFDLSLATSICRFRFTVQMCETSYIGEHQIICRYPYSV